MDSGFEKNISYGELFVDDKGCKLSLNLISMI